MTYIGYHGTDLANATSIQTYNFNISSSEKEWLGPGAYFFIDGLTNPREAARLWAIAEAWCKRVRDFTYDQYAVLTAYITAENILDITETQGKQKLNAARRQLASRYPKMTCDDNTLLKFLHDQYNFDVLINDVYIKWQTERINRVGSSFPNVRIICVKNPDSAIDKKSITIASRGRTNNRR